MKLQSPANPLPTCSPTAVRLFAAYSRHYIRRRFHSMRILKSGIPPEIQGQSVVIYLNHASWWDPLVCLVLSRQFFADRISFAPIDEVMLERYAFFKSLGFFGVTSGSARNTLSFLRTTCSILRSPEHALWITPQGRFADARERPAGLQNGLGALASRNLGTVFIPLAIEYSYWTEPRPEILAAFGTAIVPGKEPPSTSDTWTMHLSRQLESTQDALAASSCRRDPHEWIRIGSGARGVNAAYDAWRWIRSKAGGAPFLREHNMEAVK